METDTIIHLTIGINSLFATLISVFSIYSKSVNKTSQDVQELKTHISVLEERMTVQHQNVHEMLIRLDNKLERINNEL